MTLLTLTPEARDYAIATISVGGLSCPWLVGIVHARYLRERPEAYLPAYVSLMAIVCLGAALTVDADLRASASIAALGWSLPAGLLAGAVVLWSEPRVRARFDSTQPWRRPKLAARRGPPSEAPGRSAALVRPDMQRGRTSRAWVVAWLILVAILEELIFRGFLLELALGLRWLSAVAVVALAMAFALMHVQFGWSEVVAKVPLTVAATIVALGTGTVLGAAICHVVVNVRATR